MNFSPLRGQGIYPTPYMNFWFREFLFPPGPPGEAGMSPTLYEFLIQGISPSGISHSGNFSYLYEFLSPPGQGISPTLYEFLSPPVREFIHPIWISDSGNFWFREFILPIWISLPSSQGISHTLYDFLIQGISPTLYTLSSLRVREFLIQGVSDSGSLWFI